MARILYGVMGNTNGHVMRTLSIVPRMPEDEFHFVAGGRAAELLKDRYPVHEVPVLRTKHRKHRLSLSGTIGQIIHRITEIPVITSRLLDLMDHFQPDLIVSDREFFLPLAAMRARRACISIDHTHILKACHYSIPPHLLFNWSLTMLNDYFLFDHTRKNLIVSFFHPPVKKGCQDEIFDAVIRPHLEKIRPVHGEKIFVYLSIHGFHHLIDHLQATGREIVVYGSHRPPGRYGCVEYRSFDETRMVEDLASCTYAVINGGHNLISEALYFGKPILCFPIAGLFEQYINAYHVQKLGYGEYTYDYAPKKDYLLSFEEKLATFTENISKNFREGSRHLAKRLKELATPIS